MAINENSISGGLEEAAGMAQAGIGEALGDTKMQAEGKLHELKGKAEEVYGKAKEAFTEASEKAKEWAEKAPETVREARERAQRLADEGSARARQAVQEQPLAVLAGGIALGFVVGWLFSGRRD
ncbi:hypothetical protein IP88_13745 [alpha proteobacterium AAP81b]|nr:hypothetical protein IP88_13745 [alpha proteobacterium AAP81b]